MTAFNGFPVQAVQFLQGLEADNSKSYWHGHREIYLHEVRAPMEALLDDLEEEFGHARLFRAQRDVRFAKDKSPYHTHIGATIDGDGGSFYVALKFDAFIVGFGRYECDTKQKALVRDAIMDEAAGPELDALVTGLEKQGFVLSGDALKTAPRAYPADHPRIRLLRQQSIVLARSWPPQPWLQTSEVIHRVEEAWRAGRPVLAWLAQVLAPRTV